ncbi:MAG: PDZ domain-containing protein [Planctomycetia bacterium]|nr:PDZ domain-containing protein [Planctomycetia bacterium]
MRPFLLALLLCGLLAPVSAQDAKTENVPKHQVPFRLTDTKHVLVRAKINGKGPYNFIVDTGAPALFVATGVCKKQNLEPDKDGWGVFDRFEIEGGVVLDKLQGKIADPFQLEGMNRMGLAGVELHGVIGYNVLARFRVELDFTRDKMVWTPLKFDPGLPEGLNGKAGGVDAMAGMAKVMALLVGKRGRETKLRGALGVELASKDEAVTLAAVHQDSPAAEAGLKAGDRLTQVQGQDVKNAEAVLRLVEKLSAGESLKLTIVRGAETRQVAVSLGKGF